ncbi:hypothetical protein FSARC_10928 [Fusarium sarcochroum]|uniref:Heterokaryon incompatibility domain-containing protein n=1 Tax=Fusarium sarcochroum TaxID=1208366 RepID=A0A8H4TJA9_9HYPO|nr:hypothetical protein FSARC_10928 [Fusarium sarcochroum]
MESHVANPPSNGVLQAPVTLCDKCQHPFDPWPHPEPLGLNFRWYDTVEEVRESARSGCDAPEKNVSNVGKFAIYSLTDGINPEEGLLVLISMYWFEDPVNETNMRKQVWSARAFLIPGVQQVVLHGPPGEVRSTYDALGLCKTWLQNCDASHTCQARSHNTPEALPTRLIAIDDDEPRLCPDTSAISRSTSYASLSHCWGLKRFLTLTKSNFSDFTERIPSKDLPKTFQEAMRIARSLGFKYIWIDSLCIIQDDAEDWKRESVLMGSVYGRSGLNIAATGASDGQVGCLFDRQKNWRCQVLLGNNGLKPRLYECFAPELLQPPMDEIPLMRRAWVVQERFLSPRTLHFTKQQMFWVCRSLTACEIWNEGIPRVQHYLDCSLDLPKGDDWLSRSGWPSIVEQYSSCQLTMGRDKLVAISAIAQLIQTDTPDEYIAGMWKTNFAAQLCWSASGGQRYEPSVAPTWSWASNRAPIKYFNSASYTFPVTKEHIEVCDIDVEYLTPSNPFGEIIRGTLDIRCEYLKECTIYTSDSRSGIIIDDNRTLRGHTIIERMDFDDVEQHAGNDTFRAFWLPVVFRSTPHIHSGIVLEPTGVRKGEYRRIGHAEIQMRGNSYHHFPSEPFVPRDEYCARVEIREGEAKHYYIFVI